jgi:hypothetical protein
MAQPLIDIAISPTALVRVAFGSLFLISGSSKALRPQSIERIVAQYQLVPRPMRPAFRRMLGPAEIVAGVLLLASLWLPVYCLAWSLAFGILLTFSLAVASALARGLRIPCGCGLLLNGHVITRATLVRNLALLAMLALDFLTQRSSLP